MHPGPQPARAAPASAAARARARARRAAAARSSPRRPRARRRRRAPARDERARTAHAASTCVAASACRRGRRGGGGERGGGEGEARGVGQRAPRGELGREGAVDGVAGAGRVDDVDLRGREPDRRAARLEQQRAVGAERDQDGRAGLLGERAGGGLRVVAAGQLGGLGRVRREHGERRVGELARGRGVEDDAPAGLGGGARGGGDDLRARPRGRAESRRRRRGRGRRPASAALAPEATAIWFSPAASTTISATPVGASTRATPDTSMPSAASSATAASPSLVGADRADERHRGAQPRRGDGLVGGLAAAVLGEVPARDGLAGRGQAGDGRRRGPR